MYGTVISNARLYINDKTLIKNMSLPFIYWRSACICTFTPKWEVTDTEMSCQCRTNHIGMQYASLEI